MNDTLSLFDDITVDNKSRISETDRAYCEGQQELFMRTMTQIRSSQALLEKILSDNPNPAFEIRYHEPHTKEGYLWYLRDATDEKIYQALEYTPLYALKGCEVCYKRVCNRFENKIISYFNDRYGCQFKEKDLVYNTLFKRYLNTDRYGEATVEAPGNTLILLKDDDVIPTYELLVDDIMDSLGGLSFREKQDDLDLHDFQEMLHYERAELKKDTIKFEHLFFYDCWSGECKVSAGDRVNIDKIIRAARVVDGADFKACCHSYDSLCAGGEISFWGNGTTLESLKPFKNGNVTVKFTSKEAAERFFEICKPLQE